MIDQATQTVCAILHGVYLSTCIHICMYTVTYVCVCVCIYKAMCIYIYTYTYACLPCVYVHVQTCVCIYIYVHTYVSDGTTMPHDVVVSLCACVFV